MRERERERRTGELEPVHLDDARVDPPLHADDPLLPDLALLVESIRTGIGRADRRLELLDRRAERAADLALHAVGERVDLGRAERARRGRVVQGEALDAEKAVVEEPLADEALREERGRPSVQVRAQVRGAHRRRERATHVLVGHEGADRNVVLLVVGGRAGASADERDLVVRVEIEDERGA